MTKFLEHFDHHIKDLFQSTKEVLDENLPIIYNSLATVKSFYLLTGEHMKLFSKSLFIMYVPKKNSVQKFIVYTQYSRKFVQK